ncbi:MAG: ATP-binding protein [Chlorobi bacterium]|nr:ATP-binding protein [Chlorobiota bacterium]
MYKRKIEFSINEWLKSREILIIYGARQVGKTTLLNHLLGKRDDATIYNCERNEIFDILQEKNLNNIKFLFGKYKIVALDEAQTIPEIEKILKLIYDELPEYKIIVTGSSSFELSSHITEALTGRNIKYKLFPLTLEEISQKNNNIQLKQKLNELIVFGSYPGIFDLSPLKKSRKLVELTSDYLFKDVLIHESIKNPTILRKLLKALAFQLGSQVSISELSIMLGISRQTIEKYLDVLQKSFIIFELKSFSSNLRNEIKKSSKFYFYDNGIRNSIINDLSMADQRQDIGLLWENFCVSERLKTQISNNFLGEFFFWRTYDGAEIDLLEIVNNKITAFEFKWNSKKKAKLPKSFNEKYKPQSYNIINTDNFYELMK